MNNLLDNQKIQKRKTPLVRQTAGYRAVGSRSIENSFFSKINSKKDSQKTAFRPAGISALFEQNSRFIDKIKQEPLRIQRPRQRLKPRQKTEFKPEQGAGSRFKLPFFQTKNKAPTENETVRRPPKIASINIPALPVTALFLLALGVFFVINNQEGSLDWMGREVVSFENGQRSRYNLARYVGLTPPRIIEESNESYHGSNMPLDMTEVFTWQNYRVQRGDTVSQIAENFSVSMDAIIASNGISNARTLREGQILRIPNMDGIPYTVREGDTLLSISQSMGVPIEAILDANDLQSDVITVGTSLFIPGARMNREDLRMALGDFFIHPVRGARLTSPFGWRNDPFTGVRRHHAGLDLAAPLGTPVRAAMEGRVSAMSFDRVFGNFIILNHPGGFQTLYAHLHNFNVRNGDWVAQGAKIGTVGNTGLSTGPHLHFGVYRNGRAVNPLDFMNINR